MIDIKAKIHDLFSIEVKVGFIARRKLKQNDFNMKMWIFVPRGLDINPATYSKANFYQDVKSNVRLITPRYLLRDIPSEPLAILRKACMDAASDPTNTLMKEYEYHLKMFSVIVKSAVREETNLILNTTRKEDVEYLCADYCTNLRKVLDAFHAVRSVMLAPTVSKDHLDTYRYADEFICNTMMTHLFKLKKKLNNPPSAIVDSIKEIDAYCVSMNYRRANPDDLKSTAEFVHRYGSLKRLMESHLFLRVPKKRDGVLVEQIYYSLAAGLAMIFATVVAWVSQSTFGNLTWPLFVALIISYMMKDRIKELMRYYFAHRLGRHHFDNKAEISLRNNKIGMLKEAMDFVSMDRVPQEILDRRMSHLFTEAEKRVCEDSIILYRKRIDLDREKMEEGSKYNLPGINDIIRLQVNSFTHKMDNPAMKVNCLDKDGEPKTYTCPRYYYLNIVLQYTYDGQTDYKHLRVAFNRDGISNIEELV